MAHECKHDVEIAVLIEKFDAFIKTQVETNSKIDKMCESIHGNGSPGLKTMVYTNTKTIILLKGLFLTMLFPIFILVLKIFYK